MTVLEPGERTRDVYEELPGYQKPPLIPVPDPDTPGLFEPLGVGRSAVARLFVRIVGGLTGFRRFARKLPSTLEQRLRTTNMRVPGLFAPMISATAALEDDRRNPGVFGRAATLVAAAQALHADLRAGTLPQAESGGQPLEMGQYPNLFGTSMVVDENGPRVFKSTDTTHLLVLVRGRMTILEIGDLSQPGAVGSLADALATIAREAELETTDPRDTSPGILCCVSDMTQIKGFRRLRASEINRESLSALRHTFLTLCLDMESTPPTPAEAAFLAHSRNSGNRWYHSSLQLVVFANARACAICSFTMYLDGNVMTHSAAEIQRRALRTDFLRGGSTTPSLRAWRRLHWSIDPDTIQNAEQEFQRYRDNQQATFSLEGIGRQSFLDHRISPTHGFTLALQMTAKQLTGRTANVEQFLTLSRYRCMDLATPSVTTPEVVSFIRALDEPAIETVSLLRDAVRSQEEVCRVARRQLPMTDMIALFFASRQQPWRFVLQVGHVMLMMLLRLTGRLQRARREIVISHPDVYPEVPIIGRPGVRLPYGRYFGLHYQMFEEKSIVTMMPGVSWGVPNTETVDCLRRNLERILAILERAPQMVREEVPEATAA